MKKLTIIFIMISLFLSFQAPTFAAMKAGVASVVITPNEYLWLSGYAARTKPAEGKIHDLYAKAIAIEDDEGSKAVIVTTDLIGVSADLTSNIAGACT